MVALGYPAPYRVAASSLGFQTVYRILNGIPSLACGRFFLTGGGPPEGRLRTAETGRRIDTCRAVAFSVACETELKGLVELLHKIGLPVLAEDRDEKCPPIIIGGPLTALDPRLVSPMADVVVVGDGEPSLPSIGEALLETAGTGDFLESLQEKSPQGVWLPKGESEPGEPCHAGAEHLPACAATWSPSAEFKNLFLVEGTRGCKRACAFCVLSSRGKAGGRFRPVPVDRILATIPDDAPGVGLVGAAVTDHPEIETLVEHIVNMGKRVSLASIRADRLTLELVSLLKKGGLRTLTVAADGSSERMRDAMRKGISEDDLHRAAHLAKQEGLRGIKVYSMIGLPGETDDDIAEFARLALEMNQCLKTTLAVQAFVPKPKTPLAHVPMVEQPILQRRLQLIKRLLKGRVRVMPTSTRWSWVDWKVAHAGNRGVALAQAAFEHGGGFGAWRQAIEEILKK